MRILLLILLLLMFTTASATATDLDSLRQARVQVYSLLGLDTNGVNGLDTVIVNRNVNFGIGQLNLTYEGYKKAEVLAMTNGSDYLALDSNIRLISGAITSGDSTTFLSIINSRAAYDSIFQVANINELDEPSYLYKFSDSIRIIPSSIRTASLLVEYVHTIPLDSMRILPHKYRLGVVYYAAILAALDISSPKIEVLRALYQEFTSGVASE